MPPEQSANYLIQSLQKWVGDKSILLVGNGPEYTINNSHLLVRMNTGVVDGCDIWIDGMSYLHRFKEWKVPVGKYKKIVRLDKHAQDRQDYPGYILPKSEYNSMTKELGMDRPSTGMMAMWWFRKYFPDNKKFITGYNGDYNRYTKRHNGHPAGSHKWDRERIILEEWIKDEIFQRI